VGVGATGQTGVPAVRVLTHINHIFTKTGPRDRA
jgi:hypothetical protein